MKILIAADHAGFALKGILAEHLKSAGYEVVDFGASVLVPDDDYPDMVLPLARAVAADPERARGIVIGWSGQGEAMAANRVRGVRAAVLYRFDPAMVTLSREHNNANVLALGARFLSEEEARAAVMSWLSASFTGEERHVRRIAKLDA